MDTTKVTQILEALAQNNQALQESSTGVPQWLILVLTFIGGSAAFWGFLKLLAQQRAQLEEQKATNKYNISAKALEQEAEENRSFQQDMVKSTQNSYIDLVNRLMAITETNLKDINENLILFTKTVERSGSISEAVNKRLATSDRGREKHLAEVKGMIALLQADIKTYMSNLESLKEAKEEPDVDIEE